MSEQKTVREACKVWLDLKLFPMYVGKIQVGDGISYPNATVTGIRSLKRLLNSNFNIHFSSHGNILWHCEPKGIDIMINETTKIAFSRPRIKPSPRQQSEALLMEFAEWWNDLEDAFKYESSKESVTDFLNQKYGKPTEDEKPAK